MNLFNNSTTGNIQFANANGYTGGIVINANNTPPVANQTIIGTSARACVAPLLHTSEIVGTAGGTTLVEVNSDLEVGSGFILFADTIRKNTATFLTIGETSTNMRIASTIDRPIPMGVSNVNSNAVFLNGTQTDFPAAITVNVNGNNQYCYRFFPFASSTGKYMANICITFECSTTFNPWIQFRVYRRPNNVNTNTTVVPATDTELTNFNVIQKYYTTILTDKMTVNLNGFIDFNPLNNSNNATIGVAAKWLEGTTTFTLTQLTTVATFTRLN
jgi:hypothetical protein